MRLDQDDKDFIREYAFATALFLIFVIVFGMAVAALGVFIDWLKG